MTEITEDQLRIHWMPTIAADLSPSVSVADLVVLKASNGLSHAGMKPYGKSFIIRPELVPRLFATPEDSARHAPEYRNGQDIGQRPRGVHALDFFGVSQEDLRQRYPAAYQFLYDHARPERATESNARLKDEWWLFETNREDLRDAIKGLTRYIVTVESSPVRAFVFLPSGMLPDQKLRVVASDDAFVLGVLSSRVHLVFAVRVGGRQGVRNTPVYNTQCFTKFPFPGATDVQKTRIRELGVQLDEHRTRQLGAHDKLKLTDMYNVLEKLKSEDPLNAREQIIHERGLVSILRKIHDDLDAAVLDAYGWNSALTDEELLEKLVALNAERSNAEERGDVHWLRPEFQAPSKKPTQLATPEGAPKTQLAPRATSESVGARAWPTTFFDRASAIRDLVEGLPGEITVTAASLDLRFKRKSKDRLAEIEAILATFAALGQLIPIDTEEGRRLYARPDRLTA